MINEHELIKIAKQLNDAINEELEKKGSNIRFATFMWNYPESDKTYLKILRIDNRYDVSFQLYYYMNFTNKLNDEVSTIRFLTTKYESLL